MVDINKIGGGSRINGIPPELLAKIFKAGTVWKPKGFTLENCKAPNRMAVGGVAPLVYLQVCKYWRQVALSTASLWTTISSSVFHHREKRVAPATKFLLARSGATAPLDLHLELPHVNKIFGMFANHVKRWRSMSIELDSKLAPKFAALIEERIQDLDGLKELKILLHPTEDLPVSVSQRIIAQVALLKALRCFYWHVGGFTRVSMYHGFYSLSSLATLDNITVCNPYLLEECIAHLSQCVSATKACFLDTFSHDFVKTKPKLSRTTLPRLTSLTIGRTCDPIDVLDYFTLPSLTSLKIVSNHPLSHNLTLLESFLARSKCALKTFIVEGGDYRCSMLDSNLVDYLLFLPIRSIPEVEISCRDIPKRMLKILQTHRDAEAIFPPIISGRSKTRYNFSWIGWKNLSKDEELYYSWKAGKVEINYWPEEFESDSEDEN